MKYKPNYFRYNAERGCILSSHILKSQRKSRNIKATYVIDPVLNIIT